MTALPASTLLACLGLAVFHAMWEVTLLALAAWIGLRLLRRRAPRVRHAFALNVLAAMVAVPALTFLGALRTPGTPDPGPALGMLLEAEALQTLAASRTFLPLLALAWAGGCAAMVLRLAGGLWWVERRWVAPAVDAPAPWQARARHLAVLMGLRRPFRLRVSPCAGGPMVIGFWRPVILMPAAAFLHLSPEALEAVLAHELAHVARFDYLANLLQCLAEAILFFHPAAWWLSRQVRDLREHCADDLAAAVCGDPMTLAQGLSDLERLRRTLPTLTDPAPGLTLGAAKGHLMLRITRLFDPATEVTPTFRSMLPMLAGACLLATATFAAQAADKPAPVERKFNQIKVINQPQPPAYPADAKAKRIQGIVVVDVTIDETGKPDLVKAVSGPEELWPTAEDYARTWTFAPVKVHGKAVRAKFPLIMPFKLR